MKTKDRILQTSLELFNANGEPNVTTNHIADEMEISPGNLYYHYRNKEDILICLYDRFEQGILDALGTTESQEIKLESMWLFLQLLFETIWEYRFFYRDLDHILSKSEKVKKRYARILQKKISAAETVCAGLVSDGVMQASVEEVTALSKNMALTATYWLNFQNALRKTADSELAGQDLNIGVYQVMVLVAPYLRDEERGKLQSLGRVYLSGA